MGVQTDPVSLSDPELPLSSERLSSFHNPIIQGDLHAAQHISH